MLLALLLLTAVGAVRLDRSTWPAMVGDEATYAMQAASLAWDADLAYERRDYERFEEQWQGAPENLILQSTDGGEHITYGKPFHYALAVAPWLRLSPRKGAALANWFFLVLAAVVTAHTLERRLGSLAPLWVACLLFGSVSFVYTFWFHADLFWMALTALGLALVFRAEQPARRSVVPEVYDLELAVAPWRIALRWGLVGVLLSLPAAARPFQAALLVAAAVAVPAPRRGLGLLALGAGAAAALGLSLLVQEAAGGRWMGYGSERQGFYSYTGYPVVDFPAAEWSQSLERWGNTAWVQPGGLEVELDRGIWAWNALYFLVGQHVGVLPYFLPLLLGVVALGNDRLRWALLLAVLAASACLLLIRPFNFWGGSGAIANRYFLPLYPAFWFLPSRMRGWWLALLAVAAGVFVWPLWVAPLAYPFGDGGSFRHVSPVAAGWLPYETTQSHLKPGGREDVVHNGLWVKFLNRNASSEDGASRLRLRVGEEARLLVGHDAPIDALQLELVEGGSSSLDVGGGELGEMMLRPSGAVGFEILLADHTRAEHRMWWTSEPFFLYELRLRLPPGAQRRQELPFTLKQGRWRSGGNPSEAPPARIGGEV